MIWPLFGTPKVLSFMSLNQFAKQVKIMLIMPCPHGLVIRPLFDTPKVLSFMSLLNRFAKRVKIMPCPYYGLAIWPLFGTTKVLSLNPLVSE